MLKYIFVGAFIMLVFPAIVIAVGAGVPDEETLPSAFGQLSWVLDVGGRLIQFVFSLVVIVLESAERVLEAFQNAFSGTPPPPESLLPERLYEGFPQNESFDEIE